MTALTLYLARHGDTAWSTERRLAGRTDLPLVEDGERNARRLGERLRGIAFDRVLVSPLARARRTVDLAGLGRGATIDARLAEMDFGDYEGRTVDEIRATRPGWTYLRDGCPGGESADDVGRRADGLLAELDAGPPGHVVLFAHSVILRVLAARFLGLPAERGRMLTMAPGALSVLGHDHVDDARAIVSWNERASLP